MEKSIEAIAEKIVEGEKTFFSPAPVFPPKAAFLIIAARVGFGISPVQFS